MSESGEQGDDDGRWDSSDYSSDVFSTTEETSYCDRLGASCLGVPIGLLMVIASCIVLFRNEGNSVSQTRLVTSAFSEAVLQNCTFDPEMVSQLVHVTCDVEDMDTITDASLGVSYKGMQMLRRVEMYQWEEMSTCTTESTGAGGSRQRCTYHYQASWLEQPVSSSAFHDHSRHNPDIWPLKTEHMTSKATIGEYCLTPPLISSLDLEAHSLSLPRHTQYSPSTQRPPVKIAQTNTQLCGATHYYTGRCDQPIVGDLRISYTVANATVVSVLGKLTRDRTFTTWTSPENQSLGPLAVAGNYNVGEILDRAMARLALQTWAMRGIGVVGCWLGVFLVAGPLTVAPEILPCVGQCLGAIIGQAACCGAMLAAVCLSLTVMAVAWLLYRPYLGLPLLCVALIGLLWLLFKKPLRKTSLPVEAQQPIQSSYEPLRNSLLDNYDANYVQGNYSSFSQGPQTIGYYPGHPQQWGGVRSDPAIGPYSTGPWNLQNAYQPMAPPPLPGPPPYPITEGPAFPSAPPPYDTAPHGTAYDPMAHKP